MNQHFNQLLEKFKLEHIEKVLDPQYPFTTDSLQRELDVITKKFKYEQFPIIDLTKISVCEKSSIPNQHLTLGENIKKRMVDMQACAGDDSVHPLVKLEAEYDSIAVRNVKKYSAMLGYWRLPNSELTSFKKDSQAH